MSIGRPLEFSPDIAEEQAMQLFWRKGYELTSLSDLVSIMGLSRSSFYQTFKSKHKLFQQCIKRYRSNQTASFAKQLQQSVDARVFIVDLFLGVAQNAGEKDARRGCLLMNTASEFAQTDPCIAKLVSESLTQIASIFETAIKRAQQEGQIATQKNAHDISLYLVSSMSGLRNQIKAGADKKSAHSIAVIILSVLD